MCKISIIIPTYNAENFISDCLNSIVRQSFRNYEVIIVDDGSIDKTKETVQCFKENNKNICIKYYYQSNKGPAAARNNGIMNSTGDYIVFLDSDDYLNEFSLEKRSNEFRKNPELDFVSSNAFIIKSGKVIGDFKEKISSNLYGNLNLKDLISENSIITSTVMIKKSIFDKVGLFNESNDLIGVEDYLMWLRIFSSDIVSKHIEIPLTFYREHENSLSVNKIGMLEKVKKVLNLFSTNVSYSEYSVLINKRLSQIDDVICMEKFKILIVDRNYTEAILNIPVLLSNGNLLKIVFIKFLLVYFPERYRKYFFKKFSLKEF